MAEAKKQKKLELQDDDEDMELIKNAAADSNDSSVEMSEDDTSEE